jgi:phage terminase large subunit
MDLRVPYNPRIHFMPFHTRSQRFACMVFHRRAGKTVACVNELIARAIYSKKKRPRYAYIAPQLKQAKKIAWEYLKEYTEEIREHKSESELWVRLKHNGAEICIYGADNPDSFRGQYFDGVVLDEYGDMSPSVWGKIILPTLADRKGWAVFIGTFKGKNHFYKIWRRSQGLDLMEGEDPEYFKRNWYSCIGKASETGILSDEELRLQRMEQDEEEYQQEYECNPNAAVKGTYYAQLLAKLEDHINNRNADWDVEFPVEIYSDLGIGDSTSLWFVQQRPDGYAVIDYEEHHGKGLDFYYELIRSKPYRYSHWAVPHDARARTLQTGKATLQLVKAEDKKNPFPRFSRTDTDNFIRICPKLDVQDGINAVRDILPKCYFSPKCEDGVEALRAYQRVWNEDQQVFHDEPLHNWASHGSDAFRYFALSVRDRAIMPAEPEVISKVHPNLPVIQLEELFAARERRLRMSGRRV